MSWLNDWLNENISLMFITELTSQLPKSWLNEFECVNIVDIFVTELTSQLEMSWLNNVAFSNMRFIISTLLTSQYLISWLKGVDLNKGSANINEQDNRKSISRPEMKGPQSSDVDDILAGLKTRTVDIRKEAEQATSNSNGNESVISVSSLKDLQNTSVPQKSSRRKNSSSKNTISLDI